MLFDSDPLVVSTNDACLHKSDVKVSLTRTLALSMRAAADPPPC